MAYIGQESEYIEFQKQTLTADGTTTAFTLDQAAGNANGLLVSVGGAVQEPDVAYTVSAFTITFAVAPTNGYTIYIVYLGKELTVSQPADNSIAANAIVNSAVTDVKITSMAASKLTGSLNGIDGSALTGIVTDTSVIEDNIAVLGFKMASNNSLTRYNMVDQVIDEYYDATGIDASSTNEIAGGTGSGKYYSGVSGSTVTSSGNYDTTGTDGDYSWFKWTTVRTDGTYTTDTSQDYEYLVIAGGGAGSDSNYASGGGGSGGYRTATGYAVNGTITGIKVGAGAAACGGAGSYSGCSNSGDTSIFSTITSSGGGGGSGNSTPGTAGGSGGGGDGGNASAGGAGNSGSFTPVEGYAGGYGSQHGFPGQSENYQGGGGGGSSQTGRPGTPYQPNTAPGDSVTTGRGTGGAGTSSSIDGVATIRAGGGGGSLYNTGNGCDWFGLGGTGGGGRGGKASSTSGTAGTANTGSGGGGGRGAASGAGGSGIVIIRRLTQSLIANDMSLQSTANTALTAPTTGDIVIMIDDAAGTAVLNTDIKAYISRDGGTGWDQVTLVDQGTWGTTNKKILSAHDTTFSNSASGTDLRYKITTHNQSGSKETRIHATSLAWA